MSQLKSQVLIELEAAHLIIRNALNLMTPEQKTRWHERNERDGLIEDCGTTRATERRNVIEQAGGEA